MPSIEPTAPTGSPTYAETFAVGTYKTISPTTAIEGPLGGIFG